MKYERWLSLCFFWDVNTNNSIQPTSVTVLGPIAFLDKWNYFFLFFLHVFLHHPRENENGKIMSFRPCVVALRCEIGMSHCFAFTRCRSSVVMWLVQSNFLKKIVHPKCKLLLLNRHKRKALAGCEHWTFGWKNSKLICATCTSYSKC